MSKDEDEKGPLAFLDRLLDEERDSNLHLGDVRFWKHLEHIHRGQIYRTSSLEYRVMKLMCCETIFYLLFLVLFTGLIVVQRSSSLYESRRQQLDYWLDCEKRGDDGRVCKIDEITTQEQLLHWIKHDFTPKAFSERTAYEDISAGESVLRLQDGLATWTPRFIGDTKSAMLLGNVRIRQLRVQYNKDCQIMEDYADIHKDCFPKYSPGVESKWKWHQSWAPEIIHPHYIWQAANKTQQIDTVGQFGVYPGSGFVLDLPLDLSATQALLDELEEWKWLDFRTRAVIIELSVLSPNVNIFSNVRLLFEFPATGGLFFKSDVNSMLAVQMSLSLAATDDPAGTFAMLILTTGFFAIFFFYVSYLIWKNGLAYFTYFWSNVDLIILILYGALILTYDSIFKAASSEPNLHPEIIGDPAVFSPIGKFVPALETANMLASCLALFAWLKVLKYFTLIGYFMGYVRVIERCVTKLMLFAFLLMLVLFGFAVAFYLAYGTDDNVFSTIWGSLVAVIVAPAGGVDLEPIFASGDSLGPILVFVYIIFIFLLMLNTFMAICVETYTVCTFELKEVKHTRHKTNPMILFLWTYFNACLGTKLVGKETEEDMGEPNEQEIPLTSLPEAVQVRFLEDRRRMQTILESVEAQKAEEERLRREPELYTTATSHDADDDDPAPPPLSSSLPPPPPEDSDLHAMLVSRVQLQRMLEDSSQLQEICGTKKAIELVRRFRVDLSGNDAFDMVATLQESVASKLQELEARGMDLSFDEMEELQLVSQELHSTLTESQKEWRAELLAVLQMASLLSKALLDLTHQMAKVQQNHNDLVWSVAPK